MKLAISKTVLGLVLVAFASQHNNNNHVSAKQLQEEDKITDRDVEDQEFWRGLVEGMDSFPPSAAPTLAPVPVTGK